MSGSTISFVAKPDIINIRYLHFRIIEERLVIPITAEIERSTLKKDQLPEMVQRGEFSPDNRWKAVRSCRDAQPGHRTCVLQEALPKWKPLFHEHSAV